MSPLTPHETVRNAPPRLLAAYHHAPFDGRNIARSVLPSPSKSPGATMSPERPKLVNSYVIPPLYNLYQSLVDGRNTVKSARPSPLKSNKVTFRNGATFSLASPARVDNST